MERLREKDLRGALDFIGSVGESRRIEEFRARVTAGLPALIPCDVQTYDEINPATGEVLWLTEPVSVGGEADTDAFLRHIDEHPVLQDHLRTGGETRTFSDFVTLRQFHRTAIYNEFFRHLGVEAQLAALFYGPTPALGAVAFNRSRGDFSGRDRALLELLRPHLGRAYEAVLAQVRSERVLAALESAADNAGTGVVVMAPDGGVEGASAGVLARLSSYFGSAAGRALPAPVAEWVQRRGRHGQTTLTRDRDGGTLRLSFMPRGSVHEPDMLLIEERREPSVEGAMRRLGLSRRESEVLGLLARGSSNAEIAEELVISPLTVKKHTEHIYSKLEVANRTAASARLRELDLP